MSYSLPLKETASSFCWWLCFLSPSYPSCRILMIKSSQYFTLLNSFYCIKWVEISSTNSLIAGAMDPFLFFWKSLKPIGIMQLKSCLLFSKQTAPCGLSAFGLSPVPLKTGGGKSEYITAIQNTSLINKELMTISFNHSLVLINFLHL